MTQLTWADKDVAGQLESARLCRPTQSSRGCDVLTSVASSCSIPELGPYCSLQE